MIAIVGFIVGIIAAVVVGSLPVAASAPLRHRRTDTTDRAIPSLSNGCKRQSVNPLTMKRSEET
jgi:hypothetical protein